LRAYLCGRYLNRYFIVSRKKDGTYELHHNPIFGYYYAKDLMFGRMMSDAVRKFRAGYPGMTLIAKTLTLQSGSREGVEMHSGAIRLFVARLIADIMVLINLANYRRVAGRWHFAFLISQVHRRRPTRYVVVGG